MTISALRLSLLWAVAFGSIASAQSFYVDPLTGNDSAAGTEEAPFKTVIKALTKVDGRGGQINLTAAHGPYREPIDIHKGGLPDHPLVIDGHGAVINLGVDVTAGPWTKVAEGYRLERRLLPGDRLQKLPPNPDGGKWIMQNPRFHLTSPVFVNGLPVPCDDPKGVGATPRDWHDGYAKYDEQGRLVIVFPRGLTPTNSVIVMTAGSDFMSCGIGLHSASHVVIRNLTSAFSPNDGFNFHGKCLDVIMENVAAVFSSDNGISAHETSEVSVRDSEVAFGGCANAACSDIQEAITSYRFMRIHQNRGPAFSLAGGRHRVEAVVSFGNDGDNLPMPSAKITMANNLDLGTRPEYHSIPTLTDVPALAPKGSYLAETDRLGRFLEYRPPAIGH